MNKYYKYFGETEQIILRIALAYTYKKRHKRQSINWKVYTSYYTWIIILKKRIIADSYAVDDVKVLYIACATNER